MTILDSVKEAGYVISDPYFENEQVLVVKKSKGYTSSYDLAGKNVAVQAYSTGDYCAEDYFADVFKSVKKCSSFIECFTDLKNDTVDAILLDKSVAEMNVATYGYRIIDEDIYAEQYGIVFRSTDGKLCEQVEEAISALVENGTYAMIAEKYPEIINNLIYINT